MSKDRETLITDLSINARDGFFYITQNLQAEIRELLTQKRKPLSDEEVRAKYRDIALDNPLYVPSYYAGFRDAERTHGIGGGE